MIHHRKTAMNRDKLIILILTTIASFAIGRQVRSIYGFDPPYIYFYSGLTIEYLSILVGIIATVFLIINLVKNKG
jgi:hypothetical protein